MMYVENFTFLLTIMANSWLTQLRRQILSKYKEEHASANGHDRKVLMKKIKAELYQTTGKKLPDKLTKVSKPIYLTFTSSNGLLGN
jgi:hypothetical protein